MPPSSQNTSSKSAEDPHSGGRASGPTCTNYIDVDIHNDVMVVKSAAHERRSSLGSRQQAAGNGHSWYVLPSFCVPSELIAFNPPTEDLCEHFHLLASLSFDQRAKIGEIGR